MTTKAQGMVYETKAWVEEKEANKEPSLYHVVIHNDDYTPMDFVVDLIMEHFGHGMIPALDLTMTIHDTGSAVVGTFTKDVAETKLQRAVMMTRINQHPLMITTESA